MTLIPLAAFLYAVKHCYCMLNFEKCNLLDVVKYRWVHIKLAFL